MASNNAPKHDFAPAWLKIPNQENSKPPGTKQGETCSDDRVNRSYHKEDSLLSPTGSESDTSKLYRQHSFEHTSAGSKRFPPSQNSKFRHHSVDDDYYAYTYGPYSYYNGYGYPDKYNMHYGSQPSLLRTQAQRDSKYQHPHARYGAGQAMSVGYQPYYDFLPPYEYYPNDPYYTNYPSRGGSKRNYYEKEGRSNSKEGKEKEEKKDKEGEKEKPFIDDFPSLNGGDKTSSKGSKQMNGSGVWENPPNSKNGSGRPEEGFETSQQSKVLRDNNIYKNLVPNKNAIPRRPARMNGSYSREQSPYTGLKPPTPTSSSSSPGTSKELGISTTPPMDILNTRFVTQPKTLSDKKSHFLKTLRQEDNDKKSLRKSGDGDLVNGVDSLCVTDDGSNLSSSLEAEQRLLREMGWNEDDEEYEITEDEKKEFQTLSKQVQNQRNGLVKNGIVKTTIPKTWSPKHIPVYQPNMNELNETLSSSDSDSDDAEN